jgi:Cupin-like domain
MCVVCVFFVRVALVPQSYNVWAGNTAEGSSSGLHHDFHDNLYCLLRGRKRFRLYSPADAEHIPTVGTKVYVHRNGRINYRGMVLG